MSAVRTEIIIIIIIVIIILQITLRGVVTLAGLAAKNEKMLLPSRRPKNCIFIEILSCAS